MKETRQMKSNTVLIRLYSATIALLPVLCAYGSPIPGVELGTVILLVLGMAIIVSHPKVWLSAVEIQWFTFLLVIAFFSIVSASLLSTTYVSKSTMILRYLKVFAVVTLVVFCKESFDDIFAYRVVRIFGMFNTILMILQVLTRQALIGRATLESGVFRPAGFFYEPSHVSMYMILSFCLVLEDNPKTKKRLFDICSVVLGVVLSTSGTGIICLPILYIIHLILNLKNEDGKLEFRRLIFAIIGFGVGLILLVFLSRTSYVNNIIGRLINSDGSYNRAIVGRLGNGFYEYYNNMDLEYKIIGFGFGNRPDFFYMTSFNSLLFSDGIIGILLFVWICIRYFIKCDNTGKMLTTSFLILMYGTGIFNFSCIGYYFSFITSSYMYKKLNGRKIYASKNKKNSEKVISSIF